MKIFLIGSQGRLGSVLSPHLISRGYDVITHARNVSVDYCFDVTDRFKVQEALDEVRPSHIINLTGYTNVDECELFPHLAYMGNIRPVENIAAWIKLNPSTHLIHVSTDHLYSKYGPQSEEDVNPINTYALSKFGGELSALGLGANSTIIRTNFFGKTNGAKSQTFSEWTLDILKAAQKTVFYNDVFFNPLSLNSLCNYIEAILLNPKAGIFNVGSVGGISKSDFAFQLAKLFNLDISLIEPKSISSAHKKAERPKDMRMDCSKFSQEFSIKLNSIEDEIKSLGES